MLGGELLCDGVGDGVGFTALTLAEPVTVPVEVAPVAVPVTAADSVTLSPVGALAGMATLACSWVVRLVLILPSVHVSDPSPLPQTVKAGVPTAGEESLAFAESFTPTLLAVPLFMLTVML